MKWGKILVVMVIGVSLYAADGDNWFGLSAVNGSADDISNIRGLCAGSDLD